MKKIYSLVVLLAVAFAGNAQITVTNGGFENWDGGNSNDPTNWHFPTFGLGTADTLLDQGFAPTIGGSAVNGAVEQISTGSPEGSNHVNLQTTTFTNGGTVHVFPGEIISQVTSSQPAYEVTFQYRCNMNANDTAYVQVLAYNGSFQGIAVAGMEFTSADNNGSFQTASMTFIGSWSGVAGYQITATSSVLGSPAEGSSLELDDIQISVAQIADPAQNVVGSDISDNGDGSDLEVTFDKAADESTVAEYRVIAINSGTTISPWDQPGVPFVSVTPDGSASYTVGFSGTQYIDASLMLADIVENVAMDIVVVSMPGGTANTLNTAMSASPVTLTSGGGGASIGEAEKIGIMAYPNPANSEINFNLGNTGADQVIIVDVSGRIIETVTVNNTTETIDVTGYNNGVYFFQVIQNGNILKTDKFVVRK